MNTRIIKLSLMGLTMSLWVAGYMVTPAIAVNPGNDEMYDGRFLPDSMTGGVPSHIVDKASRARKKANERLAQASTGSEPAGSSRITKLSADSAGAGDSVVTIESSSAIQYTAFKLLNPLRLVLDFPNTQRGVAAESLTVNKGVVDNIRTLYFDEAGVLRIEIALNQAADYDIQKVADNTLAIRLQADRVETALVPEASSSEDETDNMKNIADISEVEQQAEARRREEDPCIDLLSGEKEKIDFDFQGADLRNIFRIFAEVSGFNLVLAPDVNGSVNVRMKDVPWNEAFEVILSNNGLWRNCLGNNIVRIATQNTLAQEEAQRRQAAQEKAAAKRAEELAGDLVTEVVRINHADIGELLTNLAPLRSTRARDRGDITVDRRTNTVILVDIRPKVNEMLELIRMLDVQTPQVSIEARIVEINRNWSQELGIRWGLTGTANWNMTSGANPNLVITDRSGNVGVGNFLVDLATTTTATSGFGLVLGNVLNGLDLDVRLSALESEGKGRVLASPKVTTLDNKEARIASGRTIPYETTSADGTATEFVDAELSLTVTPHITSDNSVYMTISATKNAADFANTDGNNNPTITTKEATTEVLVANGDTTVLGGIFESTITRNKEAVPFFSKIPFLGMFFRNVDDEDDIDELMIFVTPTIVQDYY